MQLKIVPAKQGFAWVKEGLKLLRAWPMALSTGALMYFTAVIFIGLIPIVGTFIALMLVPLSNAGFLETSRRATQGQMPLPQFLFVPLKISQQTTQRLLLAGVLYIVAVFIALACTTLMDDGLLWRVVTGDTVADNPTLKALAENGSMLLMMALMMPVSVVFWYMPALIAWEQQPAAKALFLSVVIAARNWKALIAFAAAWFGVMMLMIQAIALVVLLTGGNANIAQLLAMPFMLLLMSAVFACFYPIYRDTLENAPAQTDNAIAD